MEWSDLPPLILFQLDILLFRSTGDLRFFDILITIVIEFSTGNSSPLQVFYLKKEESKSNCDSVTV